MKEKYISSPKMLADILQSAESDARLSNDSIDASTFHQWLVSYFERKSKDHCTSTEDQIVQKLKEFSCMNDHDFLDQAQFVNDIVYALQQFSNKNISNEIHNVANDTEDIRRQSISNTSPEELDSTKKMLKEIAPELSLESQLELDAKRNKELVAIYEKIEHRMSQQQKLLGPATLPELPTTPIIIFGERHADATTENLIKKLAPKLKERGYERVYIEEPYGLIPQDIPQLKKFIQNIEANQMEVRAVDQGSLDPEEKNNLMSHVMDRESALYEARNSAMAWHYAHADVPVVGSMGLEHLRGVQKHLIAKRPETPGLENHYLCIYAHADKPRLEIEKKIVQGETKEDYPLGVMEINVLGLDGEDKAVDQILQKIDEKRQAILQSTETAKLSPGK